MDVEEVTKLYSRLKEDVYSYFYPDAYLLNQENNINQFNVSRKNGWRHFIDGGEVIKNTENYCCKYTFDYEYNVSKETKKLTFNSYNDSSGLNLLDFVNSVLNGDSKIFVKVENLNFYDARKYLFEVVEILVKDSVIDAIFLQVLKKYFHKIKRIEFRRCTIKKECNLNSIDAETDIAFHNTIIENSRSLNDCASDIYMLRASIKQIFPITIKSKKILINFLSQENYIDLKLLFLECNFPNLIFFQVDPEVYYDNYSFEDAFTYLPDSAPNLEEIYIEGKIRDLKFLTKFKYLINCNILSIQDEASYYANITNRKEKEKILERNKYQYEVKKILFPYLEDKFIISELERTRLLRLSHFLSTLSYTEEDKRIFKEKDIIRALTNKNINAQIEYYFECYFDTLRLKRQFFERKRILWDEERYRFFGKYLCQYNPTLEILQDNKKSILLSKSFLFASNGLPIIFIGRQGRPMTKEKATALMHEAEMLGIQPESAYEFQFKTLTNFFKEFSKEIDQPILADELNNIIYDKVYSFITGNEFLTYGSEGKRISYAFDTCKRAQERLDNIIDKINKTKKLLVEIIRENYNSFVVEEKAFMFFDYIKTYCSSEEAAVAFYDDYYNCVKAEVQNNKMTNFKTVYKILVSDPKCVLKSINSKTNGLYSKYCNYIKAFIKIKQLVGENLYNGYDKAYINPEDIRKLALHL